MIGSTAFTGDGQVMLPLRVFIWLAVLANPVVAQVDGQVSRQPSAPHPVIVITAAPPDRPWTLTYEVGAPVQQFRFARPAGFFRERAWRVRTPGYELAREGQSQVLRLVGDAPGTRIEIDLDVHTERLPREYEAFLAFTDGSRAIYTGHLSGWIRLANSADSVSLDRFEFVPVADDRVILAGASDPAREWSDSLGRGTYAVFGRSAPIETPHMMLLVDDGMPAWLRTSAELAIPAFFELFSEGTGVALSGRPLVLFSFDPEESPGRSSGGGTLPGVIQLSVKGTDWKRPTPGGDVQILHFFAHEASHMWNGEIVRSSNPSEGWMHEGGADAMADRALLALGLLDRAGYDARTSGALNECAAELTGGPLRGSRQRSSNADYACGNALALLTEAALAGADPEADLFTFWGELIRRSQQAGGTYDQQLYLETLDIFAADSSAVRAIGRLTDESHEDVGAVLVEALTEAGLDVTQDTAARDEAYQERWGRRLFSVVMASDCDRVDFSGTGSVYAVIEARGCATLREGMRVQEVGGVQVVRAGAAAYDRARDVCLGGGEMLVGLEDGTELMVRCPKNLPLRPVRLSYRS